MEHPSSPPGMLVNPVSSSNMSMGSQERDVSTIPSRGPNKQEHMNLPRSSYPMYSATMSNFHPHTYSGPSMSSSSPFKSQTQDLQTRQAPPHQGMVSTNIGGTYMMSMSIYEMQNSSNDPKRNHFGLLDNPASWKASVKKEQKGSSRHSMSYAKQELLDHTQENPTGRNTVSSSLGTPSETTAREEEEQLLSGLKEESRASEASRRAVQEEEERLICRKPPSVEKTS